MVGKADERREERLQDKRILMKVSLPPVDSLWVGSTGQRADRSVLEQVYS